jgi:hypothetical protein
MYTRMYTQTHVDLQLRHDQFQSPGRAWSSRACFAPEDPEPRDGIRFRLIAYMRVVQSHLWGHVPCDCLDGRDRDPVYCHRCDCRVSQIMKPEIRKAGDSAERSPSGARQVFTGRVGSYPVPLAGTKSLVRRNR